MEDADATSGTWLCSLVWVSSRVPGDAYPDSHLIGESLHGEVSMTGPAGNGFFGHRPPVFPSDPVILSPTTRYLCAAAYLVPGLSRLVMAEFIENEHRAVAPSVGFDIGPVLRHSHRSRSLLLARDGLLSLVAMLGLVATPLLSLWLAVSAAAAVGTALWSRSWKLGLGAAAAVGAIVLFGFNGGIAVLAGVPGLPPGLVSEMGGLPGESPSTAPITTREILLRALVVLAGTFGVYLWWQLRVYRILCSELAFGARVRLPDLPAGRLRQRIAAVSAAQWGNLTLTAHRNPFLGAGEVTHKWSMSLELRSLGGEGAVDPVELYQYVRDRLLAMRGDSLPECERISSLIVVDHIVATGERSQPDPLIDPVNRVPYAEAIPAAIHAIIRHPQGGLRYYLKAVVGAEGRDVRSGDWVVLPAQDQEIAVSTLLYAAVEGGMLYLEFVAAVEKPLHPDLHVVDQLAPERVTSKAIAETAKHTFGAFVLAPFRALAALNGILGAGWRMDRADRESRELRVYDFGARHSLRGLAAAPRLQNHLQELDAEKYYKLVERAVTSAVLSFLEQRRVDTSEYRNRTAMVLNNGVMITGGTVTGPVAGGAHATATATRNVSNEHHPESSFPRATVQVARAKE
jgi:hypothetical protein